MVRESETEKEPTKPSGEIERLADLPEIAFFYEFMAFLWHTKKWWLTPIVVVLLVLGVLVILAGTGAAPFVYPLF
jgi:hypothetical protein